MCRFSKNTGWFTPAGFVSDYTRENTAKVLKISGEQVQDLELELYFYLNTVNLSDKIIIIIIIINYNLTLIYINMI